MNDNFDFPFNSPNEIKMTEGEKKSHKKIFSKICLALFVYLLVSQGLSIALVYVLAYTAPKLLYSQDFLMLLSSVVQYAVAFPIFYKAIKSVPKQEPAATRISIKSLLKYLTVCMLFVYIGNYISNFLLTRIGSLMGRMPENQLDSMLDATSIYVSLLVVGLVGPIFEELIFRKLFIDRLTPYGDAVCVFFPALIFGLFHGNLYQFFYAFLIGAMLSYVYTKTGKIVYSIVIHMFINLFCGILPTLVYSLVDYDQLIEMVSAGTLTDEYVMANAGPLSLFLFYTYGFLAMVVIGFVVFWRNYRKIHLNKGEIRWPKGSGGDIMFFNAGAITLIMSCILLIAYNTFG